MHVIKRKQVGMKKTEKKIVKKKQITYHRADDGRKDHPQPFAFAYIQTYVYIVI